MFVLAQCVLCALVLGMCVPRCGWEECVTLTMRVSPHRPRFNSSRCMPLFKCQCCRRLHKLGAGGEKERKKESRYPLIGVQSTSIVAGTIPDISKNDAEQGRHECRQMQAPGMYVSICRQVCGIFSVQLRALASLYVASILSYKPQSCFGNINCCLIIFY